MKIFNTFISIIAMSMAINAHAGMISNWEGTGVDFYSSWLDADTLRIEIDAASPTAGWANAVEIDSIAINGAGSWTWANASDITLSGPGTFNGSVSGTGLNANGCQSLTLGGNHQCWSGLASLTDDMHFDFTFSGDAVVSSYTDTPHLKVRFIDSNGSKTGSLLSVDLPSVNVAEPSSLALFGLGIAGLISVRRKK